MNQFMVTQSTNKSNYDYTYEQLVSGGWIYDGQNETNAELPPDLMEEEDRAEYEAWLDELLAEPMIDEKQLYQVAKSKFNTLHVFSQPDSLTRRGATLILRRKVTVEQASNGVIDDWKSTLTRLFDKGVTIFKTDIDCKFNLRLWFQLDACYGVHPKPLVKLHDGSLCTGDSADVSFFSWCAERDNGGY